MNPFEQIALAWQALGLVMRRMLSAPLWTPWLALGLLQAGLLAALVFAAHPWISPVFAPLVARLAGERALHYPDLFLALPALYARLDLVVAALPGPIVIGAATALFRDVALARRPQPGAAARLALRRAPALILTHLPFHLLAVAWPAAVAALAGGRGGIVAQAAYVLALGGSVLFQSLFLYAGAFVIVERRGIAGALAALPHGWRHGFWAALTLSVLLVLPLLPLHLLSGAAGVIAERGRPELLAVMSLGQLGIALVASFVLYGAATLVFMGGIARRRGEGP